MNEILIVILAVMAIQGVLFFILWRVLRWLGWSGHEVVKEKPGVHVRDDGVRWREKSQVVESARKQIGAHRAKKGRKR